MNSLHFAHGRPSRERPQLPLRPYRNGRVEQPRRRSTGGKGEAMQRLLRDLSYFAIFCLMILGIIGVLYHALGKDGWIDKVLGGVIDQGIGIILGVIIGGAIIWWIGRRILLATQANKRFNDVLMYGLVALGVFFFAR